MTNSRRFGRRSLLAAGAALTASASLPRIGYAQPATTTVNLQLGWLLANNEVGDIAAKKLGYFEEEGLDVRLQPGGPSIDGIALVASGRHEIGKISSSPSLMLAASQKIPVKCFAVGAQQHPFVFCSLPKKPVRVPADLVGKRVGVQATSKILLTALLRKNGIPENKVEVVVVGGDLLPLMTGQVDAITTWATATSLLKPLGPDRVEMRLWDNGIKLYALVYYATAATLAGKPDLVARFTRAAAKGWAFARANPEEAVDLLIREVPSLKKEDELPGAKAILGYAFNENTAKAGWGTFDPAIWAQQIAIYDELGQFSAGPPKLDDVMTTAILDLTAAQRPRLGAPA
jgi:NitT/TauT family transport system substrate-binding protein